MTKSPRKKIEIPVSDLTEALKPYRSGWVALSSDESHVVSSGSTLEEAHAQAVRAGYSHPVFVKVLPPDRGYIPCNI